MKLIATTSDNFLDLTLLMLESFRLWHPQAEAVVYALDRGWTSDMTDRLSRLSATVQRIAEHDPKNRTGNQGGAVHAGWKLDVLAAQEQPFLFLDSDILVLQPLDDIWQAIERDGWFAVHEGTTLATYLGGDMVGRVTLPEEAKNLSTVNTGVIGGDPAKHRSVIRQAQQWSHQIKSCVMGDQGLLNLAWYDQRKSLPASGSNDFNGGYHAGGRIDLTNAILHFAGHHIVDQVQRTGLSRAEIQKQLWNRWPKGFRLTPLDRTDFWRSTLPHPWPWLNQCTQRKHRAFVADVRRASRTLLGQSGLLVRDAWQAYLLDPKVLRDIENDWRRHAGKFAEIHYLPLYHLADGDRLTPAWPRRIERCRQIVSSWLR